MSESLPESAVANGSGTLRADCPVSQSQAKGEALELFKDLCGLAVREAPAWQVVTHTLAGEQRFILIGKDERLEIIRRYPPL